MRSILMNQPMVMAMAAKDVEIDDVLLVEAKELTKELAG